LVHGSISLSVTPLSSTVIRAEVLDGHQAKPPPPVLGFTCALSPSQSTARRTDRS
jgi:hypothetical protein